MRSGVEISRSHRYFCEVSNSRNASISSALTTVLLGQQPSLKTAQQLSQISKTTFYTGFSYCDFNQELDLQARARYAPVGAYLAVDFVTVPHTGQHMQGSNYHYHSSKQGTCLSHQFTSSALVKFGHDPLPLEWRFKVSKALETPDYPYQTATQAVKSVVGDYYQQHVDFAGFIVDGEIGRDEALKFSLEKEIPVLIRAKSNMKVEFEGELLSLKQLAALFGPQRCHLYSDMNWRAKRLSVKRNGLSFDVLIVWRSVHGVRTPFFLFSTFSSTVTLHELLRAWKARWGIEVIHRFAKQSLGAGRCHCNDIQAHENWLFCVLEAFHQVLRIRRKQPGSSWREARRLAFTVMKNSVKTNKYPIMPTPEAA